MSSQEAMKSAPAWESDVLASDGRMVHLRPLGPADREDLIAFYHRLDPEDAYRRFFSSRLPSDEILAGAIDPAKPNNLALAAEVHGEIIGVGTCVGDDPTSSEVAFAVLLQHQHRGIGTLLLEHLAARARSVGIERFHAHTLPYNTEMLEVFERAGYIVERDDSREDVRISFVLDASADASIDDRERSASSRSIRRLLAPRTVAVIGASRTPGSVGNALFHNILQAGFQGTAFPVHPNAKSVCAVPAYPSIAAVPVHVDVAIIAVPTERVADMVEECGKARVGAAVIVTAGFAEAGASGVSAQADLLSIARKHGMRLVGPNCIGIVNTHPDVCLDATFSPVDPVRGTVSFASQSGALGIAVLDHAAHAGMGVASFVSLGNKADVSSNDLLQYWEGDAETAVGVLYLESFGNPAKFARIAQRFCQKKPLIVVKSGRSDAGKRAASSHTAALSSSDALAAALFRQAGIIRVDTLAEVFDVSRLLTTQPIPAGLRVAIVGNSGGPGILAADACEAAGLEVPELGEATRAELRELLPDGAGVANPVDLIANARGEAYEKALDLVLSDDQIDAVLVIYTDPMISEASDITAAIGRCAARHTDKPIVANFLAADVGASITATMTGSAHADIPVYDFPEAAVGALGHAAHLGVWRTQPAGSVPKLDDVDRSAALELVQAALLDDPDGAWLSPADTAELLRCYGVHLVPSPVARTAAEAADIASDAGCPVALKVVSSSILHKSDVGGVVLDLATPEDAAEAYAAMQRRLGSEMEGAIVQPMAPHGVEFIIGAISDPTFGPVVMFGAGGTTAELWADRAFGLAPLTTAQASALINEPRSSALLRGHRGTPPIDSLPLEDVVLRLGALFDELSQVAELDLNPVIATPDGLHLVDARIRIEPTTEPLVPRRRLERR